MIWDVPTIREIQKSSHDRYPIWPKHLGQPGQPRQPGQPVRPGQLGEPEHAAGTAGTIKASDTTETAFVLTALQTIAIIC